MVLDYLSTLKGDPSINQASLGKAALSALNVDLSVTFTHSDVLRAAVKNAYHHSQRETAIIGGVIVGAPLIIASGPEAIVWWRLTNSANRIEALGWTNRGFKRLIKEMDNLDIADDVLSPGGLKMPKYSTDPLPKPTHTYSQPF